MQRQPLVRFVDRERMDQPIQVPQRRLDRGDQARCEGLRHDNGFSNNTIFIAS